MRIFFSVGEPSGDLHGANLIRGLQSRAKADGTELQCIGFGGPKMKAAGCELKFDLTTMAVMFIAEVLKNLRLFFRLIGEADDYFAKNEVDAVVLIDYPGFNWWIAKKAKKHGIPVFYYGVPQIWAWAGWRIRKIRIALGPPRRHFLHPTFRTEGRQRRGQVGEHAMVSGANTSLPS